MATDLTLICHGTTLLWDGNRTLGWWSDAPLSDHGRRQALALGEHLLETTDLRALYTSPLERARETAEIISQLAKVIVRVDANLREIDAGIPSDLSVADAAARYPEHAENGASGPDGPLPGGEGLRHFQDRISRSIDRIIGRHPDCSVAVVTHGGPVIAYLRAFLGFAADADDAPFFACDAASTCSLRFDGDTRTIVRTNDVAHLARVPAAR